MSVGCIGAGSWGTTLAIYLAHQGSDVTLLPHSRAQRDALAIERVNSTYLPDVPFPPTLTVAQSIDELVDCSVLMIAAPSQHIRASVSALRGKLSEDVIVVNTSKGIERTTLMRVSEVLVDSLDVEPKSVGTLSGPSHAEEVSRGVPTALVAGSSSRVTAEAIQHLFNSDTMRIYSTDDIIGVELGGSLKNVIAICAGIVDGLGVGDNAKAALITRGLAEISRLGIAMGARQETFSGLSGLGDLIVTCTSGHSRNRFVGEEIGRGRHLPEIIESMEMVAEGVATTDSALQVARHHRVEMPIIEQVHAVLFDHKSPHDAIADLMQRPSTMETWRENHS